MQYSFSKHPYLAQRCLVYYHPSSVPLLCAAEQREGVVPDPQTCKQLLFPSATIES